MDTKEFEEFRRQLAFAFRDRTPNTECLEVIRLLMRFPPEVRAPWEDEWRAVANPENFWEGSKCMDKEYLDASSFGYLYLLLMQEVGFEPAAHEYQLAEAIDDDMIDLGMTWRPEGMD